MSTMVPDSAPKPRVCHVVKREDFSGYGFNLHAEKGKAGQFIGKVDPGSPAERAKLKESDRIVEVNGTNIGNENHQQVVQRIKAIPDETKLLVVDNETDNYYKEKKIVIRGDMPNVLCYSSEETTEESEETTEETTKSGETNTVTNGTVEARPASTASSQDIPADAPRPRESHVKIWPDFQGYGFNLHAEKGKPGQFIGHVDEGSPAEYAGLREGDRIIEVNGENIAKDNHGEVVKKIKSDPNQTVMLVLDPEAEKYYRERDITVSSTQSNVHSFVCPDSKPQANGSANQVEAEVNHLSQSENVDTSDHEDNIEDNTSQKSNSLNNHDDLVLDDQEEDKAEAAIEYANVNKEAPQPVEQEAEPTETSVETKVNGQSDGEEAAEAITESIREMEQAVAEETPPEPEEKVEDKVELNNNADVAQDYDIIANVPKQEEEEIHKPSPEPIRAPTPEPEPVKEEIPKAETKQPEPSSPVKSPVTVGGIAFAGSAKEARERMSKKRRDEVKQQQLSSQDKYNLYMKM